MRRKLVTTGDFERYMNFKRPVIVIFEGDKKEGIIMSQNEYTVKVNGEYFVKEYCTFWSK